MSEDAAAQDEAPAGPLERLLVVQQHDTEADQLRHRLNALPERARLDAKMTEIAALEARVAELTERRSAIGRDLKRLEDEVAIVEARRAETDAKLYGGAVNAARELQALQDELASLKRRQTSLEDDELELMEAAEPLDADLERLGAEQAAADEEATVLTAALAEAESSVSADLERAVAAREASVDGLDEELLAEYERLRRELGGVAVARLAGTSCGGCHLSLSAVEVDRIRKTPAGAMVHCEECGRILVH
ncbi:MAG: hypothetical protein JNK12_21120 [Acidimicrobiales bacterium]|nr:hypothetical protein [Acidimicrobiales bacterium]